MSPRRGALIVAGGRSRRMGRDKAWLELGHTHLLTHVVEVALQAVRWVVVVGSPGQPLPPLPEETIRVDDAPERAGQGPLAGIVTGLEALAQSEVELAYLGSVDAALVTAEHIGFMLDAVQGDRNHPAVAPETGPLDDGTRILHGLAGAVRVPVARATAIALLQSGQRSVRALYDGLGARRIAVANLPDPDVIRTCNTPDEWDTLRLELQRRSR